MARRDAPVHEPLRIVFLDFVLDRDKPGRSGLSDLVWDMAAELVPRGHDVHVVAPYPASAAPEPGVTVHTVRIPPFAYRWHGGYLWIAKRLATVAHRLAPDVVHAPEYISPAVFVTLFPNQGAQVVCTVPGNVYHRLSVPNGFLTTALGAAVLKWAANQTARSGPTVIAISEDMRRWWEWTGSPAHKTPMIPLGASPDRFGFVEGARERLGIAEDILHLLFVGRFSHEKGVLLLLEALAEMAPELTASGSRVTLLGKGVLEDRLRRTVGASHLEGVVNIVPWVHPDELSTWYSSADALVLPSFTEGFSRVICEAMMCGTPVIGSRIAGTEDHVIAGVNGVLFERGDGPALAAAIRDALRDPVALRRIRGSTARYALEHLSWPSIVDRIESEVYRPIARDLRAGGGRRESHA